MKNFEQCGKTIAAINLNNYEIINKLVSNTCLPDLHSFLRDYIVTSVNHYIISAAPTVFSLNLVPTSVTGYLLLNSLWWPYIGLFYRTGRWYWYLCHQKVKGRRKGVGEVQRHREKRSATDSRITSTHCGSRTNSSIQAKSSLLNHFLIFH